MDIANGLRAAEYADAKFSGATTPRRAAADAASPFDVTARVGGARAPGALPRVCAAPVPRFDAATLAHRWPTAKPSPRAFLRKHTRVSLTGDGAPAPAPSPRSPPAPPPAGGFRRRANPPDTLFRLAYSRGDLPVALAHGAGADAAALRWRCGDLRGINCELLLPLFLDGIRETAEPFRFIAIRGAEELLAAARGAALPLLPALVPPLRRALLTRDRGVVAAAALLIQALLRAVPGAGAALVPFYPALLPSMRLFLRDAAPPGSAAADADGLDFGQRYRGARNVGAVVHDTLAAMHKAGGPGARAAIVRFVPTWSCQDA